MLYRLLPSAFALLLWLLRPAPALAQPVAGTITGGAAGQPVPFVNTGLPRRGLGTVSDEQGRYRLAYNPAYAHDTVRISSIGYRARLLPFDALLAAPSLTLEADDVPLAEVSVVAAGFRNARELGVAKPMAGLDMHMASNELGNEIGTVIRVRRRPALLQSLHVQLLKNEAGPLTFRLNLYRLAANGQPTAEKLLRRDVLLTAPAAAGVLTVAVAADRVVLTDDFLLALEWIKGPAQTAPDLSKRISFAETLQTSGRLFVRTTSQAAWKRPPFKSNVPLFGLQPVLAFSMRVKG